MVPWYWCCDLFLCGPLIIIPLNLARSKHTWYKVEVKKMFDSKKIIYKLQLLTQFYIMSIVTIYILLVDSVKTNFT